MGAVVGFVPSQHRRVGVDGTRGYPRVGVEPEVRQDGALRAALRAADDGRTVELLLAQFGDRVFGYCRRMLGNVTDAEDVAQTVFVQVLANTEGARQASSPLAWLLQIARHRCLDLLKTSRRREVLLRQAAPRPANDAEPTPFANGRDARELCALEECMDRLDAETRALVVMRFHDELRYEEIARLTATAPGTLRVRLTRALVQLRKSLLDRGVSL
jgi:RNA polymerase sigma-70 factor, ECF subfamily